MARRSTNHVLEPVEFMNTTQILRESIRILLLHSSHFQSISVFLFSPLPLSLFFSHFLIHHFPQIPSSQLQLTNQFFHQNKAQPFLKVLSKTIIHMIICFPSTITFSQLGRAATIQAVADIYNGINLSGRRLFVRSGCAWVKLLYTCFWEMLIAFILFTVFLVSLSILPKNLFTFGMSSTADFGSWVALALLGVPFCVGFAHVMVVGNLARVVAVLEGDCYGLGSLVKAKGLIEGRKHTVLVMALLSNMGLRLVEFLFEFRLGKGMSIWEGPILVSMYSLVLVLETLTNAVFYYTCK